MTIQDTDYVKLDLFDKIDAIKAGLLTQDPLLPGHLAAIHGMLIQYEELAHLLSDEQIKILLSGQRKHANVQLVKEVVTSKRIKVPKTTVDDL